MNAVKKFRVSGRFKKTFLFFILLSVLACSKEKVREPVVAGKFYPEDEKTLYGFIDDVYKNSPPIYNERIFALVVPHAGYQYSGAIAGLALAQIGFDFDNVIIIAGNHNGSAKYTGVSLDTHTHFKIPGARIPLDTKKIKFMLLDPFYKESPAANSMHVIEVVLPFLKKLADAGNFNFKIIPEIIGSVNDEDIKKITNDIIGMYNEKTLLVASMDFSHYYPYEKAIELDRTCIDAILKMDKERVKNCETDANSVLLVLLNFAEKFGLVPKLIAYRNSGDVYGEKDSVVGYTAIAFIKDFFITETEKKILLSLARKSIEHYLTTSEKYTPFVEKLALERNNSNLLASRATFVTITKNGVLRGCIGSLLPRQPIYQDVIENAVKSATEDPRFPPLRKEELKDIEIEVSILDYPQQLIVKNKEEAVKLLVPGKDGVILYYKNNQSTFLPDVWRELKNPVEFLRHLCKKQSAPPDCWKDPSAFIYTYRTISMIEDRKK